MENITLEKLKDPKILKQVEQEVAELDNYGRAADDISGKLETVLGLDKVLKANPDLKNSNPKIFTELNEYLIKLKGYLLDFMSDEDVLALVEKHLLSLVKYDIDFEDRLKNFLLKKSYKVRDDFLEKVRDVIEINREELGDYLLIGDKRAEVKGFVKNWLQDYHNVLGGGRHLKLDIAKYLFQSNNAKILDSENRKYLKEILEFYEKTKLKVNDPFGLGAYPLSMFGIEVVGEEGSIKAKFTLKEGEDIPEEELPAETEEPSEAEIPQEAGVVSSAALDKLSKQPAKIKKPAPASARKIRPAKSPDIRKSASKASKPMPKKSAAPEKEVKFSLESVESIKKITPEIFRKISTNPGKVAEKIKSEAAKLVQANPENIISAKEMWQVSDLYKSYMEIVREGMDTGLSVDKVIDARGKMGKPTLSKQEFEAVVELSKVF